MPLETIAAGNKTVNPKVKLETEKGDIIIELYAAKAPVTVDSFIKHVNNYHYDGLIFHQDQSRRRLAWKTCSTLLFW